MKKFFKWVWLVLEIIIIIYAIIMTLFIFSKNKFGYTQIGRYTLVSVNDVEHDNISGSSINDLIFIDSKKKVSKGDVIYFYSIIEDKYIVKNSKLSSYSSDIYVIDNNLSVASSRVLGKKAFSLSHFGKLISLTERKIGFTILVLVPVFIIFMVQVIELGFVLRKGDSIKNEKQ